MISCFIFYSPFCLMNLLQKIPLQFDEEQGLWILRRELAVSVSHHALHLWYLRNYAQGKHLDSHQYCVGLISWLPSFVHHTHTHACARGHTHVHACTHTHTRYWTTKTNSLLSLAQNGLGFILANPNWFDFLECRDIHFPKWI